TDPALEAGLHRLHVVLLALERDHLGFRHFDAATIEARLEVALHAAALHPAAGDHADLGDAENLEDLGFTRHFLAVLGLQHAFHRRLDFIHDFVDDAVAVDGHAFLLRQLAHGLAGQHVEGDDQGVRSGRQLDVGFAHGTHALADDLDADFLRRQALKRGGDGFHRTVGI